MASRGGRALLALLGVLVAQTEASRNRLPHWQPPAPTQALSLHDRAHLQFSPKPTDSPKVDVDALFRRQSSSIGSNTCGFLTDDHSDFPCDDGYVCTNSGNFRGCCVESECSTSSFSTVCLDSSACSSDTPGTMCCNSESSYPYCVTYLWATTASPNHVFSLFVCDVQAYSGQQILDSEPQPITSSDASQSTHSGATSSGLPPRPTIAPVNGGGDGGSSTPVGPIVGGVVGGLALIGIVVLGVVFLVFRNRRKNADGNGANGGANYSGGNVAGGFVDPATGGPLPPPPGADMSQAGHMSMYAPSAYGMQPSGYQPVSSYGPSPPLGHATAADDAGAYAYHDPSKQFGDQQPFPGSPPPGEVSEAPAHNPLGMGANRAELS